jgi:hypothetical protein
MKLRLLIPRTFKLSFPSYLKCKKWCILDNIDKIIWILPFLSVLDVISALYVESLGYSLALYEAGFFAGYFVGAGLTYVYIVVYLSSVSIVAYVLWHIKNKKLNSSVFFDKVIFLFLVGVACYIYIRLTVAFIGNFVLPFLVSGRVSWFSINLLAYLSTAFTLFFYLRRDVIDWVRENGSKKE